MHRVFVFGAAERGCFGTPHFFTSLGVMAQTLGNPPEESLGIAYGVQTLLFQRELFYFRVEEEGFSRTDYLRGITLLQKEGKEMQLSAIGLPGVGDQEIISAIAPLCLKMNTLLIFSEKDLYDYLAT